MKSAKTLAAVLQYTGRACGICGTGTRAMFAASKGGGKNTRRQRSRWHVCENGHQLFRKETRRRKAA